MDDTGDEIIGGYQHNSTIDLLNEQNAVLNRVIPTQPPEGELDEILTKVLNEFYDYITEKDIVKAAHEYSEKTIFKESIKALLAWHNTHTREAVRLARLLEREKVSFEIAHQAQNYEVNKLFGVEYCEGMKDAALIAFDPDKEGEVLDALKEQGK